MRQNKSLRVQVLRIRYDFQGEPLRSVRRVAKHDIVLLDKRSLEGTRPRVRLANCHILVRSVVSSGEIAKL